MQREHGWPLAESAVPAGEVGAIFIEHVADAAGFGFGFALGLGTRFGFDEGFGDAGGRRSARSFFGHPNRIAQRAQSAS